MLVIVTDVTVATPPLPLIKLKAGVKSVPSGVSSGKFISLILHPITPL